MKSSIARKPLARAALVVAACSVVAWLVAALDAKQSKEAPTMPQELFKPDTVQTACFGRMLLELPKGAKLQASLYQYRHNVTGRIEERPGVTSDAFRATVLDFERGLRTTRHRDDPSLLRAVQAVPGQLDAKVFVHWEDARTAGLLNVTGFLWRDGIQYRFASETGIDKAPSAAERLVRTLSDLRTRPAAEIPSAPGFCLDTAFIPDQLKGEEFERAEVSFQIEPWEGAHVSVQTFVNQVKEPTTLLQRLAKGQSSPGFGQGYSVIRAGKRAVGELQGEELLVLAMERQRRYFHFMWEVEGAVHRNDPPDIKLEVHIRQDGNPGEMTKEQALVLWEYLLPRLKLRPVSATSTNTPNAGKRTPLGERHVTGHRCPQTGWWECDDPLDLAQRPGIWLEKGQLMPMALVWREPSLWQQLKGERPVGKTPAVWRLASYERPPGGEGTTPPVRAQQPPPSTQDTSRS